MTRHGAARNSAALGTAVGTGVLPSAVSLSTMSDAQLVAVALRTGTLTMAELSRALGLSMDAVRRARRAPTTLPLRARLTLAAVTGYEPAAAPVARELRRRTLAAMRATSRPNTALSECRR